MTLVLNAYLMSAFSCNSYALFMHYGIQHSNINVRASLAKQDYVWTVAGVATKTNKQKNTMKKHSA